MNPRVGRKISHTIVRLRYLPEDSKELQNLKRSKRKLEAF